MAQFMFSTVLLHWFIHGDGKRAKRELKLSTWLLLNRGLGDDGEDIPTAVQQQVHTIISHNFIK